ncbi:UNVERIFIED_CONTAM: hypothetical protein Sradi_0192500 [Sesamum radiatum]|uniref:CCHC-type domain-containing protein n=1 Tax=Sesamum radiatum TaxID=300843 RepID=A0AAW2W3S6_SESRA
MNGTLFFPSLLMHTRSSFREIISEQDKLIIQQEDWIGTEEQGGYYLVGKILLTKAYRIEAIRSTLMAIMNPKRGMVIREIEDKRLLFKFNHLLDQNRVLEGRPWTFERNLIVLNLVELEENPRMVNLDWSPFHVHIHGLPMRHMTTPIARHIGNRLGIFVERAQGVYDSEGSTVRIRVEIDIRKCLNISSPSREHNRVSFSYERLPLFCYICGLLGHIARQCDK